MSDQHSDVPKSTSDQPLIELARAPTSTMISSSTTLTAPTTASTTKVVTVPISKSKQTTSQQNHWRKLMIEQIKEGLRQQTTVLRRKITILHQDLLANPVRTENLVQQFYGLDALIKNHVHTIETKQKPTGQLIEGFWNLEYQQKWAEVDTLFKNLTFSNSSQTA